MQPPIEPKPEQKPESTRLSEQLKKMFHAIIRRPFLKLSALLLAIAFWAIVIASDPNLMIEKTIQSATVTVAGLDALRISNRLIVMDDLTSKPITVKMRVSVKQSDFDRATAESFSPRLDLQQITNAGENQRINFTALSTSLGTVISFDPEYIEVDVEPYASYRVPVVVERVGEALEPLWIKSATPDITSVTVSGPKSLVDQIVRSVVTLPLESLSADRPQDSINALLELRDANNNPVVSSRLLKVTNESMNIDSVRIAVEVFPMREIPVYADGAVIGLPEHGYALGEVRVSPQTIFVAATQEVLDALESVRVQTPLNIAGANSDKVSDSLLRDISGVAFSSENQVTIEADIVPAPHVHTFVDVPVTVMGLSPDLTARLSKETMSVVIRGNYQSLETLDASQVHLTVDASNLEEGVHTVTVECLVDGCDTFLFTPEMPRLTLTLSKVKGEL